MKYFLSLLILSSNVYAYTLNNNFGAAFGSKKVKVFVAGNTVCINAGLTVYEIQDLIRPAINEFWNRVPSSALRLHDGGFTADIDRVNTGRLCAPTDEACMQEATTSGGPGLIPPVDEIVIACNQESINFGTTPALASNVLAVTIPNKFNGKKIKGAMILINDTSTAFADLSHSDKVSVIAHEIGHAIGLGHSEDTAALMYYKVVDLRKDLGQDDVDGVSYLYPVKLDGCGLMGTIDTKKANPQMWQMGIGFLFIFIFSYIKKSLKRA